MLDIIIPCYNSHETIDRCLGSILSQRILPSITVTLVNDGGNSYKDVIKRYSPIMNIKEIGYEENGGAAKARNYGLENTKEELIMFVDSDDVLSNPFATVALCNEIHASPKIAMVISKFVEEVAPMKFTDHEHDTSFMHGKIYRRSFIDKYKIRLNENTRYNEDVGFNLFAVILAKCLPDTYVTYIDYISYYWLYNPNSVVRKNKEVFDNTISFVAFVNNLIYVSEELDKRIKHETILAEKATGLIKLYKMFTEITEKYPKYTLSNFTAVKQFYIKVYKQIENMVTDNMINQIMINLNFSGNYPYNRKGLDEFIGYLK